jgi:hypothetical protein
MMDLMVVRSPNDALAEHIVVRLTAGGLNNSYVSLAENLDFFPAAAVGPADEWEGLGTPLTLHFAGMDEPVQTDIAAKHKIFRRRGPWRKFFAHHHLTEGDEVLIERLSACDYRITPRTRAQGCARCRSVTRPLTHQGR